ncbi:hypothetical protein HanXRQr2_Chr09g0417841 [Helianthus annuus]|uniref:Uncharacterized protein n=1 Tax=Helianthus annuus TaxID=4232 RepID=A0A9K3NAL7_HELAN|nr:hypothetical protein HanXRQr2_Chr09g0417841 [Helianthus annuus]KAJ0895762.1 hypothetical protein HanPSC8_Chr09g0404201 [Helianthus annuus]
MKRMVGRRSSCLYSLSWTGINHKGPGTTSFTILPLCTSTIHIYKQQLSF